MGQQHANAKRKNGSRIALIIVVVVVVAALVAGWGLFSSKKDDNVTVVTAGIVSEADTAIWDTVNQVLAKEGKNIKVKTKTFQGGSGQANQAVDNGDLDFNAFQNKNFLKTQIASQGYKLAAIGDIYISKYNVYSKKYNSVNDLPDGAKIAIPNNPANAGRAYDVLARAGLITVSTKSGELYPTKDDVTGNPKHLDIEEVDPNEIPNLLEDYDAGITNAYAIIDHGMDPDEDSIYAPKLEITGQDSQWVNVFVVRQSDKNNKIYQEVLKAYQSKEVAQTIQKQFKGAYVVAFKY